MSENILETPGLSVGTFCGSASIPDLYGGKSSLCVQIGDDVGRFVQIPVVLLPRLIEVLEQVVEDSIKREKP